MKHLKFCPKCGNGTLIFDGEKKFSCGHCDFVMYHNCAAAVAVVIRCGDEVFLTKRNQNPKIGKLDLAVLQTLRKAPKKLAPENYGKN